jgi:hypothetical protein
LFIFNDYSVWVKNGDAILRNTFPSTYIRGLTFTGRARVTCAAAARGRFLLPGRTS